MIFRSFQRFGLILCLGCLCLIPGSAQQPPANPADAPPVPPPQPAPSAPRNRQPAVPDYPDPRTFTIGAFYWFTVGGSGPDIIGGLQSTTYSTLTGLGKPKHNSYWADISYPITRTGELHLEGGFIKGVGNQNAPLDTTIYGATLHKGDYLATQYQVRSGRLYLNDLLYPHKFPVSKFRLKSIWAVRYLGVKTSVDAPLQTDSSGNLTGAAGIASRQILFPEFGLGAEYALAPHVLFKAELSGFGWPHRSYIWDGSAAVEWRRGRISIEGGLKALGFKTTPNKDEYVRDMLQGGYVGVRYHFQ